jgi:hypothetical protein
MYYEVHGSGAQKVVLVIGEVSVPLGIRSAILLFF